MNFIHSQLYFILFCGIFLLENIKQVYFTMNEEHSFIQWMLQIVEKIYIHMHLHIYNNRTCLQTIENSWRIKNKVTGDLK